MEQLSYHLLQSSLWGQLLLSLLAGFLIGMELKDYRKRFHGLDQRQFVGTARTYTLVSLMGFVFFLINLQLYLVGLVGITLLFALHFWHEVKAGHSSILLYLVMVSVYTFGPLAATQPLWVLASVFVTLVLVLNAKTDLAHLGEKLSTEEISTLAKLVLLSAVILPLLPQENISSWIPVSPFKVWMAVVVVSAVSYLGYLAQKYWFADQGILITGIFGGLYSSTATTVVLAHKSHDVPRLSYKMTAAMVMATGLMYLRLIGIAAVFLMPVAEELLWKFGLLALLTFTIAGTYLVMEHRIGHQGPVSAVAENPLELKVALMFALMFVLMAVITQAVTQNFGDAGLGYLSIIVGLTDIDPFVLSLLNGNYGSEAHVLASAIMMAAGSNNLLKAFYAWTLGEPSAGRHSAVVLALLGLLTIGLGFTGISFA